MPKRNGALCSENRERCHEREQCVHEHRGRKKGMTRVAGLCSENRERCHEREQCVHEHRGRKKGMTRVAGTQRVEDGSR
jgi:hypothetical protein